MAEFQKVNPNPDGNAGAFFGKTVDALELDFGPGSNVITSVGPYGAWPAVIRTVEATGTIEVLGQLSANNPLISLNGSNANTGVRLLTSGVNADTAAGLQAAIQALGVYVVYNSFGNAAAGFSNVNLANVQVRTFTF